MQRIAQACLVAAPLAALAISTAPAQQKGGATPRTPIEHVMLIVGENRSFDHLFGTFHPPEGQTIWNLVSTGILAADGSPGPKFAQARQWRAAESGEYSVHPAKTTPFASLPTPNTGAAPTVPRFPSADAARAAEPGLPMDAYAQLTTGGTGLPRHAPDTRFPAEIASGPYVITKSIPYDAAAGDPVHRFFQMWQQLDCDIAAASPRNPSGCRADLFPWVEVSVGPGSNGKLPPEGLDDQSTHEGAVAMGVYHSAGGDMPYLTLLARRYALADNYHQAIQGGTGANHLAIGYGGTLFYAAPDGRPAVPPANQIENPNPMPGTANWYTQDGYRGGSYVNCADASQPGVAPVMNYLKSLPYRAFRDGNCRVGAYYLVNNYGPPYLADGTAAPLGADKFTIPPSRENNLGLLLSAHHVSWRYYGEGWNHGQGNFGTTHYCGLCNPFQYSTAIMTDPAERGHLQGVRQLYDDIAHNNLPAVAIVKPDSYVDGHPASSKLGLFEAFCRKIVDLVQADPNLWRSTAIMITFDEGGGYWDSGYVQPLDFFGDGIRVPLVVVSPYSEGRGVVHAYSDHVSFAKFVEANWRLPPIAADSRDNLPNPVTDPDNPYVPKNSPAIGDLMAMFGFGK